MDDKELAAKVAKYRKQAEAPNLPAAVKNQLLDNAVKIEQQLAAKAKPGNMAKGGMVAKASPKPKAPATKPAMKKAPALAVMTRPAVLAIAVGKPKAKMAKGGAVKKGC